MNRIALICTIGGIGLAAGCRSYVDLKDDLLTQSRRGIAMVAQAAGARQELIEQFYQKQRNQLDAAFDADVRSRASLDAQWVIEARKAYAVGIDSIHSQQSAAQDAHASSSANLRAVEQAIAQLQLLHSLEKTLSFPEVRR